MVKSEIVPLIQAKIAQGRYEYSKHATDQSILRGISASEIRQALLSKAELIEDYPEDHYGPSCLLLGFAGTSRPIHVLCSYPNRDLIKLITVYEPDPREWINYRTRK